jgi:HSP20 family molecular chaperone IbpA
MLPYSPWHVQKRDHYEVTADVPGFSPMEVSVNVLGRWVTIAASKHEEKTEDYTDIAGWKHHHRERRDRALTRRIKLPRNTNFDEITANIANGVLTLWASKKKSGVMEEPPRKLRITA